MAESLGVRSGDLILVKDHACRLDILQEALLAVELAGGTPLVEIAPPDYLSRFLTRASPALLTSWDQHRQEWARRADRLLVLSSGGMDWEALPQEALSAWRQADHRLTLIEDERRLPSLYAAVPTEGKARELGLTLEALESHLYPALKAGAEELRHVIAPVLKPVHGRQRITIQSGDGHALHLTLGDRQWMNDDGYFEEADRQQGGIVSNLPAGAIYTTVLETETQGSLWLPKASGATDVVFRFEKGRIVEIGAAAKAETLQAIFEGHTGESGRVAHIGLGLNPYLTRSIGWTLVDEHIYGSLLVSLGENRYMSGQNESTLNVDFAILGATLLVDGQVIVQEGKVVS